MLCLISVGKCNEEKRTERAKRKGSSGRTAAVQVRASISVATVISLVYHIRNLFLYMHIYHFTSKSYQCLILSIFVKDFLVYYSIFILEGFALIPEGFPLMQ